MQGNTEETPAATLPARMKTQMFHIRIDDRDRDRIARLAAHHEVNAATVIRMLIKQAAEALPEEPKATPRTAKKKRSHSAE
mgnify:CR=1 FL=1